MTQRIIPVQMKFSINRNPTLFLLSLQATTAKKMGAVVGQEKRKAEQIFFASDSLLAKV